MTRAFPPQPIVGVGGAIVVTAGGGDGVGVHVPDGVTGVVLVRRRSEPLAGEWSLPGGAVEVGETLVAALTREIEEETGLVVRVGEVLEVLDRITVDLDRRIRYHFVLIDYVCWPVGGRLQAGSDAAEVVIADTAALASYRMTAEAARVVQRAVRVIAAVDVAPGPSSGPQ